MERPKQINCQQEPPYPGEMDAVIFRLASPDWTAHLKHKDCEIEYPHKIEECGLWKDL